MGFDKKCHHKIGDHEHMKLQYTEPDPTWRVDFGSTLEVLS